MRHWKRGAALVLSLLLLAGCAAPAEEADSRWDPALKNTLGLTPEQRLEDYDHLVKTLKDSYLCLGVHDRENPEDPAEDIFRKYREMVAENDSDDAFYSAVYSTLWRLGSYGHLWIIEPEDYYEMLDWCKTQDTTGREQWKAVTEASEEQYAKLKAYLDGLGEEDGGSWSGGGETGENLHTLLLPEEGVRELTGEALGFGYRKSFLSEHPEAVALYGRFRLTPGDPEAIRAAMRDLLARRRASQPLEWPSAGSTFKRPEGHFAGTLIEQCGLKGRTVGGAQVSEKHAGFLINRGGATCADIRELIRQVQEVVFEKTGVRLEPEVRFVD